MKKSHYMMIAVFIGLTLVLSACMPGIRVVGTPGISLTEEMVFVSYGQHVYGLDVSNGSVIWHYPEEGDNNIAFYAKPLVTDEFVYVGDLANNFHKLDKTTGIPQWTFTEARSFYLGQAAELDGVVFAPNNDGRLYAIDANGGLLWSFETGHYIWNQPQIVNDIIYLGSMDKFVYAISTDGEEIWSAEMAGAITGKPVIDEDGTQVFVGSIGKDLVSLNTSDGSILWTFEADESIWGDPILFEEVLYFADSDGNLYALDASNGNQNWRVTFTGGVVGGLVKIDDGFALATDNGVVRAFNLDGSPKWESTLAGEIYQAPVVNNDYLIAGTIDGENLLYGFNLSGVQLWSTTPEN